MFASPQKTFGVFRFDWKKSGFYIYFGFEEALCGERAEPDGGLEKQGDRRLDMHD